MKILIIGGTRFIGPHVVRLLHNQGHEVTIFHRGKTTVFFPEGVSEIIGDRKNLIEFKESFKKLAPLVVLDMIPLTEHDAADLKETFRGIANRVVAISSIDIYRAYGKLWKMEQGSPDAALF